MKKYFTVFLWVVAMLSWLPAVSFATGFFFVDDSGNVAIGNTSPQAKLDVSGTIYSRLVSTNSSVNWNSGNVQSLVLTTNPTLTFSNGQAGGEYKLILNQDITGNRTVTWPASVKWPNNTAPYLSMTASSTDVISFVYDGTNYFGSYNPNNYHPLLGSLVSYWKLDEPSSNASDSIGLNTLTNNNSLTYSSGKINNASTFSAAGTMYLEVANGSENPTLDMTGAFTLQAWVKKNGNPADTAIIAASGDRDNYSDENYLLYIADDGKVGGFIGDGITDYQVISTGTITDNSWHHIVFVYIPSTSIKIYIDGSNDGTNTTSIPASLNDPNKPFAIGRSNYSSSNHYFGQTTSGQIDEVAVWSRALSIEEITELYNGGAGLQYPF